MCIRDRDYLIKPLDFDNLQATREKALAHMHSIDAETPAVSASQFGMVGKSPAMQDVYKRQGCGDPLFRYPHRAGRDGVRALF